MSDLGYWISDPPYFQPWPDDLCFICAHPTAHPGKVCRRWWLHGCAYEIGIPEPPTKREDGSPTIASQTQSHDGSSIERKPQP